MWLPLVRGLSGLFLGAVAGHYLFFFMVSQGFYALALPGALVGLGCGIASRIRSPVLAVACGAVALVEGILLEWQFRPFTDESLSYFVFNLHQTSTVTLAMIGLGVAFASWFGLGRARFQPISSD